MRWRPVACAGVAGLLVGQLLATGSPAWGTFPGRNGEIVFGMVTDAGRQLFTVTSTGHDLRQITHGDGDASFPDWSPDGRWIVFDLEADGSCSIILMHPDGSDRRDLSGQRPGCEQNASFTPDGRAVVFVAQRCEDCTEGIWISDLSGSHRRRITASPAGRHSVDPNVSPNGDMVSFVAEDEQNRAGLYSVAMAGGPVRQLVAPSLDVSRKDDWSPDGQRILFSDNANELDLPANLATVRPDGGGIHYLTHYTDSSSRAYTGSFSPDGHWVVLRLESPSGFTLARMPAHGGPVHAILGPWDIPQSGNDWGAHPGPT
jgi:Tol biopolymer transport system component